MRVCCDCVRACVKYTHFTLKEEGKKSVAGRKTVWKILHKLFVLDFRRDLDGDPEADSSGVAENRNRDSHTVVARNRDAVI